MLSFPIQARLPAIEAAKQFVNTRFPNCNVAILTGSAIRGEATPYSDLDILIISDDVTTAYVEAFREYGWMIEILMHNRTTHKRFFESDRERGRPSLPHMFATGIALVDDGTASEIQLEAQRLYCVLTNNATRVARFTEAANSERRETKKRYST